MSITVKICLVIITIATLINILSLLYTLCAYHKCNKYRRQAEKDWDEFKKKNGIR